MNLYEVGVLILISVLICLGCRLDSERLRKYITESSEETRANIQRTRDRAIANIGKSGKEDRAKLRDLSKQITSGGDKELEADVR